MKRYILLYFTFNFFSILFSQSGFIIDHRHTNLAEIPDNWIDSAQKKLNVRYYRRSHGSQVDAGGMLALRNYSTEWAEKYNYSENNVPGALKLSTYWLCVDYDTTILYAHARQFLDDPANAAVNVMMFAWSYNFFTKNVQTYIDTMENFIRDYGKDGLYINSGKRVTPVTFVFNTACSLGDDTRNEKVFEGNKKIRQYCIDNNRILYDFNDIEQYNPDGQYFGDGDGSPSGNYVGNMRLSEDLSYLVNGQRTGNWGREWNDAHPSSELAILSLEENCEGCFHSEVQNPPLTFESRLNCVLKGRAIWYLWARLAGWDPDLNSLEAVPVLSLNENNLNGNIINLSLTGDSFSDNNLNLANFSLSGYPAGTNIQSITYIDNTHANLYLAFNGSDFDSDINNASITIAEIELSGTANLTSNNLSIEAYNETLQISSNQSLIETNLQNAVIDMVLSDESFTDNQINISNIHLINAPQGLSVLSVSYTNNTNISITLAFDGSDFDLDISNFHITIDEAELVGLNDLSGNNLNIDAIIENPAVTITSSAQLNELSIDQMPISVLLTNQSFFDNTLNTANFSLNNFPSGCTIQSISYLNSNQCELILDFNGSDFDSDINNASITIAEIELSGTSNLTSNNLSIEAYNETLQISSNQSLIETNLQNAVIDMVLSDESFTDNQINISNIHLINAPQGLSVLSISYANNTNISITLAFDGSDFDLDISNFHITIDEAELVGLNDLSGNNLNIDAIIENPTVTITSSAQLNELSIDQMPISVLLTNQSFFDNTLNTANFSLNNFPSGCTIQSISYLNSSQCELILDFNGSDFDSDINIASITIADIELSGTANLTSNNLSIEAYNETLQISSNQSLIETNLQNTVIDIALSDESFTDNQINISNIHLINAPQGLSVLSVSYANNTNISITLAFDGSDFDLDISNFHITIDEAELVGLNDLFSNNLSIGASLEINVDYVQDSDFFKIFPNPSNGKITLEYKNIKQNTIHLQLIDSNGKIIFYKMYPNSPENKIILDFEKLDKGFYFINIIDGINKYVNSIIIQ